MPLSRRSFLKGALTGGAVTTAFGFDVQPALAQSRELKIARTTETRSIQGTGLGLPIVRQIVQLCGGKVWATSDSGLGSVFHVQLPLLEPAAPAPIAA